MQTIPRLQAAPSADSAAARCGHYARSSTRKTCRTVQESTQVGCCFAVACIQLPSYSSLGQPARLHRRRSQSMLRTPRSSSRKTRIFALLRFPIIQMAASKLVRLTFILQTSDRTQRDSSKDSSTQPKTAPHPKQHVMPNRGQSNDRGTSSTRSDSRSPSRQTSSGDPLIDRATQCGSYYATTSGVVQFTQILEQQIQAARANGSLPEARAAEYRAAAVRAYLARRSSAAEEVYQHPTEAGYLADFVASYVLFNNMPEPQRSNALRALVQRGLQYGPRRR